MKKTILYIFIPLLVTFIGCSQNNDKKTNEQNKTNTKNESSKTDDNGDATSIVGTYRCWHYEINDAPIDANCRTFAPLILNEDGTYSISSEEGKYKVDANKLILSESEIRGDGKILKDWQEIMFEYDINGDTQRITYLREKGSSNSAAEQSNLVDVKVAVAFPKDDSRVSWINVMKMVSTEDDTLQYETLATADDNAVVTADFYEVPAGASYTVYTSTGLDEFVVGTADLKNPDTSKNMVKIDITYQGDTGPEADDEEEEEPLYYYEWGEGADENPGGPEY